LGTSEGQKKLPGPTHNSSKQQEEGGGRFENGAGGRECLCEKISQWFFGPLLEARGWSRGCEKKKRETICRSQPKSMANRGGHKGIKTINDVLKVVKSKRGKAVDHVEGLRGVCRGSSRPS